MHLHGGSLALTYRFGVGAVLSPPRQPQENDPNRPDAVGINLTAEILLKRS
jgi:hypothetical protein